MRLDKELTARGCILIDGSKCTQEWLKAFMEMTRRVRYETLNKRYFKLRLCLITAMLLTNICMLVGLVPCNMGQAPIIFAYWILAMLIILLPCRVQMFLVEPEHSIKMEICFIKGTLAILPDDCSVLQVIATEANKYRECTRIDFEKAQTVEACYAVCRCKSTIVVTPLRDYEQVDIID